VAFGQPNLPRGQLQRPTSAWWSGLHQEIALPRGVPLSQIALAWVLGHPAISTALVGARTPAEVDANDAGTELDLTPEERAKIDAILSGAAGRVREFTPLRRPWNRGAAREFRRADRPEASACGIGVSLLNNQGIENSTPSSTSRAAPTSSLDSVWSRSRLQRGHVFDRSAASVHEPMTF